MKKNSILGYITGFGIGLASLIPGTIKDKASIDDVVAQLQPQDSQEQVNETNYKTDSVIEYAKNVVGPSNAYGGGAETPIVDMYDWDGVCRKKSEYFSKVPSADTHCWFISGEAFKDLMNKNEDVYNTLNDNNLLSVIDEIDTNNTDTLAHVTITDKYFVLEIKSNIPNYSDMIVDGKPKYFVWENLGKDISRIKPYFEE